MNPSKRKNTRSYHFAVVTRVGAYPSNHACELDPDIWFDSQAPGTTPIKVYDEKNLATLVFHLRIPVFHVGEILILSPDGREPGYSGRKPSKWDVTVEEFSALDAAVARAREVMA